MAVKKILIPFDGDDRDCVALRIALALGRTFAAHVEAFHGGVDPRETVAFVGEGMTAAMLEQIMAVAEQEESQRSKRARQRFEEICTAVGAPIATAPDPAKPSSAELVIKLGREDELIVERGRLADLIVAALPAGGEEPTPSPRLHACLRETGRPVLVVPTAATEAEFGRRIAIGWNGSMEASRAVKAGLPFLRKAERIVVLSVEESARIGPPGAAVVDYLAWHGIKATSQTLSESSFGVGKAFLEGVGASKNDFLIMGAYTRSHMRRLIFGGVTGEVLARTTIPVLMVH